MNSVAFFQSSTRTIPVAPKVPRHIAIIMDGNGRWAKQRFLPRVAGHQRGVECLRETVRACGALGVEYLTVFAFSSENWRRPADEVSFLMQLFLKIFRTYFPNQLIAHLIALTLMDVHQLTTQCC